MDKLEHYLSQRYWSDDDVLRAVRADTAQRRCLIGASFGARLYPWNVCVRAQTFRAFRYVALPGPPVRPIASMPGIGLRRSAAGCAPVSHLAVELKGS